MRQNLDEEITSTLNDMKNNYASGDDKVLIEAIKGVHKKLQLY